MSSIALQHPLDTLPRGARTITGIVTGARYSVDGLGRVVVDTTDAPRLLATGWLYADLTSRPGNPTSGTALLDFGAFPGSPQASLVVASPNILNPLAQIDAWVLPAATADHTSDEHLIDPPRVAAINTTPGTSFTLYAFPSGRDLPVPPGTPFGNPANSQMPVAQQQLMPVGKWNVAWAFSP